MEEVRASYSGLRVSNTYFALLRVEWHSPTGFLQVAIGMNSFKKFLKEDVWFAMDIQIEAGSFFGMENIRI